MGAGLVLLSLQKSRPAVSSLAFWFPQTKIKASRTHSLVSSFTLLISGYGGVFWALSGFVKHIEYH